jgi:glycosyltransferase involved in cell wall biosynthesis
MSGASRDPERPPKDSLDKTNVPPDRPIRLLVVVRHPVGGIRTYFKYTYGRLHPSKYRLTFVMPTDLEGDLLRKDLADFAPRLISVPEQRTEQALLVQLMRVIRRRAFDVIHSHGFTACLLTSAANLFHRLPHVFTSHDVLRDEMFSTWNGAILKATLPWALRGADRIQSVSADAQENLLEHLPFLSQRRRVLRVIPNGIIPENFPAHGDSAFVRRDLQLRSTTRLFGFLGRFMEQKGFLDLVDAVERLARDSRYRDRFRVVAVNDRAYMREYRDIIHSRGLDDWFHFAGFLPKVSAVLHELDALVVPSRWEAGPILPMEALVAGCPLIASDCIGLREVVQGTPALVVPAKDPASLAAAMSGIIEAPEEHRRRALDYVPTAVDRYDSRKSARALEEMFEELLAERWGRRTPSPETPRAARDRSEIGLRG